MIIDKVRTIFKSFFKSDFTIWISGILLIVIIAKVFFDRILAAIFLIPYLYIWFQEQMKKKQKEEQWKLKQEGKDFFQSLMNCLSAGYSLEESIPIIKNEMSMIYSKKKSVIIPELTVMERKLQMNQAFEIVFYEFAEKYENEDFIQFSYVLKTAKKRGGNLIKILEQTIETINRKNQAEQEIATVLAGRVFEKNIMKGMPVFLICYLKVFNSSYLEIMYHTLAGRICMCISLITIIIAGRFADRIVEIEV